MRSIIDQLSGHTVTIRLVGNKASMTANGHFIETEISPADLSMAKVCIAKRDLEGFGALFDTKCERVAA